MAEVALAALYRAVKARLTENSGELWGAKVFPDLAPSGTQKPYVVYAWMGGGEINARVQQDAEIVLQVKLVTDQLAQAFSGAGRISTLFNDADYSSAAALNAGSEWAVLNVKQETIVHMIETVDGRQIYHAGHRFRFRMERI